ncbi:MAG TPA: AAA family ATPase [Pirellulales bacterium]|jgi:chromosome partitioning protein
MRTVAIISQKGGAGKTTLAVHLAVEAERSGLSSAIIDLDPQASATGWGDSRRQDTPAVVSAQAARLGNVLQIAKQNGARLALIDTAPHSEAAALAATREADLILIPCRPAILDLRAISQTVDLARIAGKPAAVVLNAVPARGSLTGEAIEAVTGYGIDVADVQLGQRAAFVHCLTAGLTAQEFEPGGKAAREIKHLFRWMMKRLGVEHDNQETKLVGSIA